MPYRERISSITNLTMDAIIENCRNNIPPQYRNRPYTHPELNHGLDLLNSEEVLDCYIGAYGEMHQSKCRAALQNMPFPPENTNDSLSLEIVDWGCGQGIGAICVVDFLKERNLTQWLKKITLIEPSRAALNRAVANVSTATNGGVRVIPINEYLPSVSDNRDTFNIAYEQNFVIHIFSNILDVESIHLGRLAQCMAIPGHKHYILCMGPLNANAFRIDRFCEILQPTELFTNITSNNYGRTSDTNYCFTCKTKGFVYHGQSLDLSKYNPSEKASEPVYGEYNVNLLISNKVLSKDKAWVYYRLNKILSSIDLIYLNPELNGTSPDFVIIRPNIGIIIVSLFEEDLNNCVVNSVDSQCVDVTDSDNKTRTIKSPYSALEHSQHQILENIKELAEAVIDDNRNLSIVKKVLICTKSSREQAIQVLGNRNQSKISIYGSDFLNKDQDPSNSIADRFFYDLRFHYRNPIFDEVVLAKLKMDLSPSWHSYREGEEVNLSTIQKHLAKSVAGGQAKISGVAGSGKTQVLVTRAVNAQVRSGGNILLLTYNITLVNYISMRLSKVRADFPWDKIHIDYYARFCKKHANVHNLPVKLNSFDDEKFFDTVSHELTKYDAILIDEVQDYKTEWLHLIRNNFLKEGGEFVVFGDPKQNIYHRELDNNGDIRLGIIPGNWNRQLTTSHRFSNPSLVNLARRFQSQFIGNPDEMESSDDTARPKNEFNFNLLNYRLVKETNDIVTLSNEIYAICKEFIETNELDISKAVILAPQTALLKEIDYKYRIESGRRTTTTFVSKEVEQKISEKQGKCSLAYRQDVERLENVLKNQFTMLTHDLKISTIQSFKGWDASTVICIIYNNNAVTSPELVYTGITRTKENLLVINIGDNKYHDFFSNLI